MTVVSDMAEGMPGHRHHAKLESEVFKADSISVVEWHGLTWHALPGRTIDLRSMVHRQFGDAADVVGVVMRDEDRTQRQSLPLERVLHREGVAWIHHHGAARVERGADQPEVVVRESPHGTHVEHRQPPLPLGHDSGRAY